MGGDGRHRVVVVGGGFGGLQAALAIVPLPVDVLLVDRRNFHLFQPLAYQVATGSLSSGEICAALRQVFRRHRNVEVVLAEATGFDLAERRVQLAPVAEDVPIPRSLHYDTLIVAAGSQYSYFGHDEWRPYAPELKTLEGALDIRRRILTALEAAEWETDEAARAAWLTFVVVGAGPTGVEMAGQIAEMARDSRPEFRQADTSATRVLLIEALDRVLPPFPPSLSAKAARSLQGLGVTPLTEHSVTAIDEESVTVRDGAGETTRYPARTVVWAAGVAAVPLARELAEAAATPVGHGGRTVVEPDLTLRGHPEVIALGDMVAIQRGDASMVLPGVAPVAMQQGRYAGRLLRDRLQGRRTPPFRYRDKGNLATIGRARAVADLHVVRLSGFPAWLMWLAVHLWYLIGFQNRLVVLIRWAFSFVAHGRGARIIPVPPEPEPEPGRAGQQKGGTGESGEPGAGRERVGGPVEG